MPWPMTGRWQACIFLRAMLINFLFRKFSNWAVCKLTHSSPPTPTPTQLQIHHLLLSLLSMSLIAMPNKKLTALLHSPGSSTFLQPMLTNKSINPPLSSNSISTSFSPSNTSWWIVVLNVPLLDSMSDYSKCNILFLVCLYLSQGENSYPTILYHYPHGNSTIWGENTRIK